jgi:hypothetical protein
LALPHFERAVEYAPQVPSNHFGLGYSLSENRAFERADEVYRAGFRIGTGTGLDHAQHARVLMHLGRTEDARRAFADAVRIAPELGAYQREFPPIRVDRTTTETLRASWEQELAHDPPEHGAWDGYAEFCLFLGREDDYRAACERLIERFGSSSDPHVLERVARACLLAPPSPSLLERAGELTQRVLQTDPGSYAAWALPYFQLAHAFVEYRRGRFEAALQLLRGSAGQVLPPTPLLLRAMAHARGDSSAAARLALIDGLLVYDWSAERALTREDWLAHILRREAEPLVLPRLASFRSGAGPSFDAQERALLSGFESAALVGAARFEQRWAALARHCAAVFEAFPDLACEFVHSHRHEAARAAVMAAAGKGGDAAELGAAERAQLRAWARAWLGRNLAEWSALELEEAVGARETVRYRLEHWRADAELAPLREAEALAVLEPAERAACEHLWRELDALLARVSASREAARADVHDAPR